MNRLKGLSRHSQAEDESTVQTGAALFPALVWAHYRWERQRHRDDESDETLEHAYLSKLDAFQATEGRLEYAYWSTREASAVAMTVKPSKQRHLLGLSLREADHVVRLHRLSDWVVRDAPRIAELLHECDLLAIKVGEILRGTSERIAMRWIFGVQAHLLGFFEREPETPDRIAEKELVNHQHAELVAIETYYHRAASRAGRIVYVTGMLIGVLVATVIGAIVGSLLWVTDATDDLNLLLISFGAGAIGALVSAMTRMGRPESGNFNIDFELGRPLVRRLGVYRPFVGAVMGVAVYFVLASGILDIEIESAQEPFYYGFAAFLSGFSERFAKVVLGSAERRLVPTDDGDSQSPSKVDPQAA